MEFIKVWVSSHKLNSLMIYLLGLVLLLQSIFWWLLRSPIISLDWIIELKFFNFFVCIFLAYLISGKSK